MSLQKLSQAAQSLETVKGSLERLGTKKVSSKEFIRDYDPDLIDTTKYSKEIDAKDKKEKEKLANPESFKGDDKTLEPVDLDDFLAERKAAKSKEFLQLQMEQGFYFSDAMDAAVLHEMRENEGYYLIGVNFNALFDLFDYAVNHEGEPTYDENGNPMAAPKEDILKEGDSMAIIGEWIDKGWEYEKILRDQVGLRLGPKDILKPENIIDDKTRFQDIMKEGTKYTGLNRKYLNPMALHNMAQILDKYKKNEMQWLRAATAIDIVYKYMSQGKSREQFFQSRIELDQSAVNELDEFFKTDHLFMTLAEITQLKSELEFYRSQDQEQLADENTADEEAAANVVQEFNKQEGVSIQEQENPNAPPINNRSTAKNRASNNKSKNKTNTNKPPGK